MLDQSLFVTDELHKKDVTLADGSVHTLYFRELPASVFQKYAFAMQGDDDDQKVLAVQKLIVKGLADPDGKPAITLEQAKKLKAQPLRAIFRALQEVNSDAKKEETGSSGTDSPSPSEDEL